MTPRRGAAGGAARPASRGPRSGAWAAPHAPEAGAGSRLLGPLRVTGAFWYRFHHFGVRVVPRPLVAIPVHAFTLLFFFGLLRIRRAIADNLIPLLGPAGFFARQRRIHRTMLSFAWCLTERYEWLSGVGLPRVELDGIEHWERVAASPAGVILVTAHVGNWEIGASLPASREGRRIHVVREEELDPRAQRFIADLLRRRMGELFVTHFAREDLRLGVALCEALGAGDLVALQIDRPRAGGRTLPVELFGRPFELPVGPFALARTSGAQLLPVFVLREGRLRYRLRFHPPIVVARSADRERDLAEAARAASEEVARAIRRAPHQWFCFRNLWAPVRRPAA